MSFAIKSTHGYLRDGSQRYWFCIATWYKMWTDSYQIKLYKTRAGAENCLRSLVEEASRRKRLAPNPYHQEIDRQARLCEKDIKHLLVAAKTAEVVEVEITLKEKR